MTELTSNIMKVGAHLDDTKVLVCVWDETLDAEQNVERIVDRNLLGLPSHSRANDLMVRALRPRFISPDKEIIGALAALSTHSDAFGTPATLSSPVSMHWSPHSWRSKLSSSGGKRSL